MAKSNKTKVKVVPKHIPQPTEYHFYIGEKYYRRLQPIPFKYIIPCTKRLKKYLESIKF